MTPTLENYKQNEDGSTTLESTTNIPDTPEVPLDGYADLIPTTGGSRVTVLTEHAGKAVPIITRIQDNTTAVGSVYIYDPATVPGESFQIRSTNASDSGTVYWSYKGQL